MAFEYLYHVSNVFFLISYVSWHDIVLRGSLALAFTFLLIWSILTNTDYLAYVIWNSLFIAINCIHLFRLFYQRRPIRLTPLEEEAFRYCFQQFGSLTRSEFCDVCAFVASLDHRRAQLWRCGVDRTYEDGETIAAEGSSSTSLGFLVRGKVQKVHDNRVLHTIIRTRAEDWVFLFRSVGWPHIRFSLSRARSPPFLTRFMTLFPFPFLLLPSSYYTSLVLTAIVL